MPAVRLSAEADAWALSAASDSERLNRRHMLGYWYRFLSGREPTPALGAEFETYIAANASPLMAPRVLSAVRTLCRLLIAQGTMAVYPFPADPRCPVPPEAEAWLSRHVNHQTRRERRNWLRRWFRFLAEREPSQALADEFAAELAATRSEVIAKNTRGAVNSYLRARAADSGETPIVVRRRTRVEH